MIQINTSKEGADWIHNLILMYYGEMSAGVKPSEVPVKIGDFVRYEVKPILDLQVNITE